MPVIKLNNLELQNTVNKAVQARILFDLSAEGRGQGIVGKQFRAQTDKLSEKLAGKVASSLNKSAKLGFAASLATVSTKLQQGIAGNPGEGTLNPPADDRGWKPLSRKYYSSKLKYTPQTANKFWKQKGDLSAAFQTFLKTYLNSWTSKQAVVTLASRGFKYRGQRLRYEINITLPRMNNNKTLEDLFLKTFATGDIQPIGATGQNLKLQGLSSIGYLEGQGAGRGSDKRYRPFIAKTMASRGAAFQKQLETEVKRAVASANR